MTDDDPKSPDDSERRRRHRERQGQKKVTLRDLIKETPSTNDAFEYFKLVQGESDRGLVIMGSALVEHALTKAIICAAGDPDANTRKAWFENQTAPFQTFAAKIQLGRALHAYDADRAKRLALIKDIRNAFSHRALPLDFSHPTVQEACDDLRLYMLPEGIRESRTQYRTNWRLRFLTACITEARYLEDFVVEYRKRSESRQRR